MSTELLPTKLWNWTPSTVTNLFNIERFHYISISVTNLFNIERFHYISISGNIWPFMFIGLTDSIWTRVIFGILKCYGLSCGEVKCCTSQRPWGMSCDSRLLFMFLCTQNCFTYRTTICNNCPGTISRVQTVQRLLQGWDHVPKGWSWFRVQTR